MFWAGSPRDTLPSEKPGATGGRARKSQTIASGFYFFMNINRQCECGCGQNTLIAQKSNRSKEWIRGLPIRFIKGHGGGLAKRTHGMRNTPEFHAFHDAKQRCTNTKNPKWAAYGGRGIQFRLTSFDEFFLEIGPRPGKLYSLDRMNNDGHYEPGNIRWATRQEQIQSRRLSGSALTSHTEKIFFTKH